jgi:lipoate-protein ligase B
MTEIDSAKLDIIDLGIHPYGEVLELQMDLCQKRQDDVIDNTVLIVEHPAVITLGARKSENKLLMHEDCLRDKGVEVVRVGRGGGTTAHNPGQLVFYPIIKLKSLGLDVNAYVRSLEQVGIELLQWLGVQSDRRKGFPGLWIGEKKIASVGVQLKKWVSLHGMAININNDLSIFEHIVPCGLKDVVITSVQKETGKPADMDAVKDKLRMLYKTQWRTQEPRWTRINSKFQPQISYETGASGMGYNTGSYERPNF